MVIFINTNRFKSYIISPFTFPSFQWNCPSSFYVNPKTFYLYRITDSLTLSGSAHEKDYISCCREIIQKAPSYLNLAGSAKKVQVALTNIYIHNEKLYFVLSQGNAFPINYDINFIELTVGTLVYLNGGDDLSVHFSRVEKAGGKVTRSKTPIGKNGFMPIFMDTEGNRVAFHSMM